MENQEQDKSGHTSQQKESEQQSDKVSIDAQTYNALLDRLDELEAQVETKKKETSGDDDLDDLYNEGTRSEEKEEPKKLDLDRMSQAELAGYIESELSKNALTPLMQRLAQMELNLEIDRLEREGVKDFEEHREDVLKTLYHNPRLSVKKAYTLVTAEKSKTSKAKEETEEKQESRTNLRHLPPRPKVHGEKPTGAASNQADSSAPLSTRDAAKQAIEDLDVKFPVADADET